jgi:dipeptidase E
MKRLLLISNSTQHGSGYLDHCEAEIRDFLGQASRIVFVPFALHDRASYAALARRRFRALGIEVSSLHDAPDPQGAIREAGGIFAGGGNTFRLLEALYRLDLLGVIRQRVEAGAPYLGASAGSNVACLTIKTTNDMPIVQPPSFDALGLVPFNINPHYLDPDPASTHQGETREERIRQFHEVNDPPVVGLREGAMLRVEGSRISLQGSRGARIFIKNREPREASPGDALDFLLSGAPT